MARAPVGANNMFPMSWRGQTEKSRKQFKILRKKTSEQLNIRPIRNEIKLKSESYATELTV